ncbi:hypothetical protein KIF59_18900 [Enterobacter cloacae subsp. cloacae]|nr:hypothetical protein [Enterobacter cloacae subsp. cloacae]
MAFLTFDYGNNIRQMAKRWASATPLIFPICPCLIFVRCSVAVSVRSAGGPVRATRRYLQN